MSWLENIRKKSHEEKVRVIYIVVGIVAILLVFIWVGTSKIGKDSEKDTTLFQTIGRGMKDLRENYKK